MAATSRHHVRDLALAAEGLRRIERADAQLPVLRRLRERFERDRPFAGVRVAACLHATARTAALLRALQVGGADLVLCAASPQTTEDDVAAALVAHFGIPAFAVRGENGDTAYAHIEAVCDHRPQLVLDDGAEVIGVLHAARREQLGGVIAGTEQTSTGVLRLRALEREGKLAFPVLAAAESQARRLLDDRHGAGQAGVDAVVRATGALVAGATWVVVGYGDAGSGIARCARGLGAQVVVCEVEPQRALEAALDGFRVQPLVRAAAEADVLVAATGGKHVVSGPQLDALKDGAVLANVGRLTAEIDLPALRAATLATQRVRPQLDELRLQDGRTVHLVSEGRPVAPAGGESRPAAVMDVALAAQALAAEYAVHNAMALERRVYAVPRAVDRELAGVLLSTMGIEIDQLTEAQARYLATWDEGA